MVVYQAKMSWSKVALFALSAAILPLGSKAQTGDPNAPYEDAYDVLHGDDLVGTWEGTISGSSISQGDGQMAGMAVFPRRGYENSSMFGVILHDHRHRDDQTFSEILISDIPCGPEGGGYGMVTKTGIEDVPAGFGGVTFINQIADTGRSDFQVHRSYGAELESPASIVTRWSDDRFTLSLEGEFMTVVAPVKNQTFDYDRQDEAYEDRVHLSANFTLDRTAETEQLFDRMMCDEPDTFEVVDQIPANGRENVVLDGAEFFVEFSDELAKGSLEPGSVSMFTRDSENEFMFVDLDLDLVDETDAENTKSLRITPRDRLRPGVIYQIAILGGDEGIRGRDRQYLEEPHVFYISTIVDPEEVKLGIYQVVRNAPLVYNKPAAARIHFEWEELEDIHPDWQVLDYKVRAEVLSATDQTIFPEKKHKVERTDQYTDADRQNGLHTINLFDWSPSRSQNPTIFRAEVHPDNPYPEDVEVAPDVMEQEVDYATRHIDQLSIAYFFAEHLEWADGGMTDEMAASLHSAARAERAFINQIYPVADVTSHYQGRYDPTRIVCSFIDWGERTCLENHGHLMKLFQLFDEYLTASTTSDILVTLHPPSMGGDGKAFALYEQPKTLIRRPGDPHHQHADDPETESLRKSDRGNRNMILMTAAALFGRTEPAVLTVPLIAHEVGHVFALPHIPYADSGEHRAEICKTLNTTKAANIDGMRISLNGGTGWQKSSKDGNAETSALRNLMFPCIVTPRSEFWIDQNQYDWLIEKMPQMIDTLRSERAQHLDPSRTRHARASHSLDGLLWRASLSESPEAPRERWLMVSGLIDGEGSVLLPTINVPGPRSALYGAGPHEILVEDATGHVLARATVGGGFDSSEMQPFSVTVPVAGDPARVVLRLGDETLAESRANRALAAPKVSSHKSGSIFRAGDTLAWGAAPDEGVTYTVNFTANGQDWRKLAVLLSQPTFTPDPQALIPGPGAAFEIIAHDGLTERAMRLPVEIDAPLLPLFTWPGTGEGASLDFNVAIDARHIGCRYAAGRWRTGGRRYHAHLRREGFDDLPTLARRSSELHGCRGYGRFVLKTAGRWRTLSGSASRQTCRRSLTTTLHCGIRKLRRHWLDRHCRLNQAKRQTRQQMIRRRSRRSLVRG